MKFYEIPYDYDRNRPKLKSVIRGLCVTNRILYYQNITTAWYCYYQAVVIMLPLRGNHSKATLLMSNCSVLELVDCFYS